MPKMIVHLRNGNTVELNEKETAAKLRSEHQKARLQNKRAAMTVYLAGYFFSWILMFNSFKEGLYILRPLDKVLSTILEFTVRKPATLLGKLIPSKYNFWALIAMVLIILFIHYVDSKSWIIRIARLWAPILIFLPYYLWAFL